MLTLANKPMEREIHIANFRCYFVKGGSCKRNSSDMDGKIYSPLPFFWNLDENQDLWHIPQMFLALNRRPS